MLPRLHRFLIFALCGLYPAFAADNQHDPAPQSLPGDVINTVDKGRIDEVLKEVVANNGGTHIRTGIAVAALTHSLSNPQYKLKDGVSKFDLPEKINAGQTGLILFQKYSIGVKGVHGVVAYNIDGTDLILAIQVTIPENSLLYGRFYNMKIYYKETPVDGNLVDQMYEYAGVWNAGVNRERTEYGVTVRGTMTNYDKAHIASYVDASNYNIRVGPTRHAECEFKTTALGSRCWRECTPTGWCWTPEKCSYDTDCHGNMFCGGGCNGVYTTVE